MALIEHIQQQRDVIDDLAQRYGARHVRVFGSVARGEERPDSDVDFLVELPRGYDLFTQRMPLAEALKQLLHRSVDLIPEHELNPQLKQRILDEAVEL